MPNLIGYSDNSRDYGFRFISNSYTYAGNVQECRISMIIDLVELLYLANPDYSFDYIKGKEFEREKAPESL